jgi:hypothetical protein
MHWLSFLVIFASFTTYAQTLPRLKKVEGRKVVFQSQDIKEVRSRGLFKTRVVTRWGVHVYESMDAYFKCSTHRCRLAETRTRDFFSSCGHASNGKFRCERRIRPDDHGPGPETPGYWERNAEGDYVRRSDDGLEEYPSRDSGGDWETGGTVLF